MLSDYGMMGWMVEGGWERKQRQTFIGTPCWMAPEVMEQASGYDYKADIWSLGITAIEIAQGMVPYYNAAPMKVLLMTLQNPPPTVDSGNGATFSEEYKNFVATCLQKDPTQRPSSSQLLAHPLFAKGVKKPPDLEDILAKLPPIGSRAGAAQKQLVKQLTKSYQVAKSGIFEKSSKGQGWDFGDGEQSLPDSSTDTLIADESRAGALINTGLSGDNSYGDRRYAYTSYDQETSSRGGDSFTDGLTNPSKNFLASDGSAANHPTSIPAKTVGMLRRGRFTVSDVGDNVESRLADFLDDQSSTGEMSNSSSFNNMPLQGSEGSPQGPANGVAHPQHNNSMGLAVGSASTSAIATAVSSQAASTIHKSSTAPTNSTSGSTPQANGGGSTAATNANSTSATNSVGNAKGESGSGQTQPVRKSRFEVYDVESKDTTKPSAAAAVIASTVSSSAASTPSQSGSLFTSKPRSKSRFEVKDVDPATLASLPLVSAAAVPIQHSSSPRRASNQTPSVQSYSTKQSHQAQPSVLSHPPIVAHQHSNEAQELHQPHHALESSNMSNIVPQETAALLSENGSSVAHLVPQEVIPPPIEISKLPARTPPPGPTVVGAAQIAPIPAARAPVIVPSGVQTSVLPLPVPSQFTPFVQPTPQLPQHLPTHQQAHQSTPAMQSALAIQTLSTVASLHSNILSLMQESDRLRQENDFLRSTLATSQTQQQLQNGQLQQMQQQNQALQQQLQHFHHQQQMIYQQKLYENERQLQLQHSSPPNYQTLSTSSRRAFTPMHGHVPPSSSPPHTAVSCSDVRSTPVMPNKPHSQPQPYQSSTVGSRSAGSIPPQPAVRAVPKQAAGHAVARTPTPQQHSVPSSSAPATVTHQPRPVVPHPAASGTTYIPNGTIAASSQARAVVQSSTSANGGAPKHSQRPMVHSVSPSTVNAANGQQRVPQSSSQSSAQHGTTHTQKVAPQHYSPAAPTTGPPQRAVVISAGIPTSASMAQSRPAAQSVTPTAASQRPVVQLVGSGNTSTQQQRPVVHHVSTPSGGPVASSQQKRPSVQHVIPTSTAAAVSVHQVKNVSHSSSGSSLPPTSQPRVQTAHYPIVSVPASSVSQARPAVAHAAGPSTVPVRKNVAPGTPPVPRATVHHSISAPSVPNAVSQVSQTAPTGNSDLNRRTTSFSQTHASQAPVVATSIRVPLPQASSAPSLMNSNQLL